MNCEILETLYVKSNGEIPCNDDAGEQVILGRIDQADDSWSITSVFENEKFAQIRAAYQQGRQPWQGVCEKCAFFRSYEAFADPLKSKRIRKLQLEPSLACNLSCPCCCNSIQIRTKAKPHIMPPAMFEKLLRSLLENSYELGEVEYCGQGEPLMHPQFASFPRLATEILPATRQRLITNGNFDYQKKIGPEFIDEIMVSCDGVRQASYEQYRVRGNVDAPLKFMHDVGHVNGRKPLLIWKYILFEFNDSDADLIEAQRRAQEMGVDTLMFVFTHSQFKSVTYPPELAPNLPILYPNVVTNLTPILFNRDYVRANSISPKKRLFARHSRLRMTIDEVALLKQDVFTVRGWALANEEIERIVVRVDDAQVGAVRMGLPRADVADAFPDYENTHSGFSLSGSLGAARREQPQRLQLTAHLASGTEIVREFRLSFAR